MTHLTAGDFARDFSLPDHNGISHTLSEHLQTGNVLLVFNIGFAWPHCLNHMAQLCHDYEEFKALNTEVLVMVPNGPRMIGMYTAAARTPYPILTDKGAQVAETYFQTKKFFSWGTPTVFLVDHDGIIRYAHYATSMIEEPDNREPLAVLKKMAVKTKANHEKHEFHERLEKDLNSAAFP